jgi:CRP-like cAMP-binding protein
MPAGGDLCLILSDKASVRVDEAEVATVSAGMHVGEIGLLEPFKGRSATVLAIDTVVAAQVSQTRFTEIERFHADLWRRIAYTMEIAR